MMHMMHIIASIVHSLYTNMDKEIHKFQQNESL